MSYTNLTSSNATGEELRAANGRSMAVNVGGTFDGATVTAQMQRNDGSGTWVDVVAVTTAANFELVCGSAIVRFRKTGGSGSENVDVDTWDIVK